MTLTASSRRAAAIAYTLLVRQLLEAMLSPDSGWRSPAVSAFAPTATCTPLMSRPRVVPTETHRREPPSASVTA